MAATAWAQALRSWPSGSTICQPSPSPQGAESRSPELPPQITAAGSAQLRNVSPPVTLLPGSQPRLNAAGGRVTPSPLAASKGRLKMQSPLHCRLERRLCPASWHCPPGLRTGIPRDAPREARAIGLRTSHGRRSPGRRRGCPGLECGAPPAAASRPQTAPAPHPPGWCPPPEGPCPARPPGWW